MWQVLVPYLHPVLVFAGFVLEPWQWVAWFNDGVLSHIVGASLRS